MLSKLLFRFILELSKNDLKSRILFIKFRSLPLDFRGEWGWVNLMSKHKHSKHFLLGFPEKHN